jgi:hypothetical protein
MAVHTTINGLTRDQLIEALKTERDCGKDIKEVWSQWGHQPGKPELAHALWPILAAKIARCRTDPDAPVPEIAEVIHDAYLVAQRWRFLSFALSEESAAPVLDASWSAVTLRCRRFGVVGLETSAFLEEDHVDDLRLGVLPFRVLSRLRS